MQQTIGVGCAFDEFEVALPETESINDQGSVAEDAFFLDALSEAECDPVIACVQRPRRRRRRGRGPFRRRPLPTRRWASAAEQLLLLLAG
eukprot:8540744-Alexandrium_andersonii.AAC.1